MALISAYALKRVMDYDESCGGQAEFMIMKNDGEFGYEVDTAIPMHPCEEFPDRIHTAMWRMLRKLIRAKSSDTVSSISSDFEYEIGKIIEARGDWIKTLTSNLKDSIAKAESDS